MIRKNPPEDKVRVVSKKYEGSILRSFHPPSVLHKFVSPFFPSALPFIWSLASLLPFFPWPPPFTSQDYSLASFLPPFLGFLHSFSSFIRSLVPSFLFYFLLFIRSFLRSFVRSFSTILPSFLPSSTLMPTNLLLWVETQVRSLSSSH